MARHRKKKVSKKSTPLEWLLFICILFMAMAVWAYCFYSFGYSNGYMYGYANGISGVIEQCSALCAVLQSRMARL